MSARPPDEITVLCVDDDDAFLDLLTTYLARVDDAITPLAATDASDALTVLADENVDCIVSDYDMPEMDGIEFLRAVRESGREMPFVLFTAKGSEDVASDAISAGVSDYLQKTRGTDQYTVLANRIRNLVRLHRMEERVADEDASDAAGAATATGDSPRADERREAFDALAAASADGIIMLDDDSIIRYANPAVERILGYTRDELVGASKMKIIPERLRELHADGIQRYLETGTKHIDWTYVELPGKHRDGHEVPLAISLNDFEFEGEHYFVGTFRDISDRKEVERKLRRRNEHLDQFASIVSHDLRTPLSVVRGYLELLDDDLDDDRVDRALDGIDRIESIVEDTLALAREGKIVDSDAMARIDLADHAEQCWRTVDPATATLDVDADRTIRADPDRLSHVFENLYRNAIEHGPPDVTVRVGVLDDEPGFYVEDDGPGIPEADRDDVLEAGYTTTEEGSGFGLAIVERIADAHGWSIRVTESRTGGARFEFTDVETAEE